MGADPNFLPVSTFSLLPSLVQVPCIAQEAECFFVLQVSSNNHLNPRQIETPSPKWKVAWKVSLRRKME
jgi:hypothetical protein